jgi:hypothetical protein
MCADKLVIRSSAVNYDGRCTVAFEQLSLREAMGRSAQASFGACDPLVDKWMAKRAAHSSMWEGRYFRTHQVATQEYLAGELASPGRLRTLLASHSKPGGGSAWLDARHLRLETSGHVAFEIGSGTREVIHRIVGKIQDAYEALADVRSRANCLKLFMSNSISEGGVGHVVGAHIPGPRAEGIYFFDANIGEFWFPDATHLGNWMEQSWIALYLEPDRDFHFYKCHAYVRT